MSIQAVSVSGGLCGMLENGSLSCLHSGALCLFDPKKSGMKLNTFARANLPALRDRVRQCEDCSVC